MNGHRAENIISTFAEDCTQCRLCLNCCALLNELDLTPGEVAKTFLEDQINDDIRNAILRCDLCGLCGVDCPANLEPQEFMIAARNVLIKSGQILTEDYQSMLVDQDWNFFSLYRKTYGVSYEDFIHSKFDTLFFPGCTLSSYSPELTRATYEWLTNQGLDLGFSNLCCGKPLESIGLLDRTRGLRHHIWKQMQNAGAVRLITACPNCWYHLKEFLPGIEVISLYDFMNKHGLRLNGEKSLSIHDSCPDRSELSVSRDIRQLLAGHKNVEMKHFGNNILCCGSGGIVSMIDPELCQRRAQLRMAEWKNTHTDQCVTACMACAHRLARASQPGNVIHILEIIFNIHVDYAQIDHNAKALWKGEQGKINLARLSQARRITDILEAPQE